eukprot:676486-Amphidinium_carterae.2
MVLSEARSYIPLGMQEFRGGHVDHGIPDGDLMEWARRQVQPAFVIPHLQYNVGVTQISQALALSTHLLQRLLSAHVEYRFTAEHIAFYTAPWMQEYSGSTHFIAIVSDVFTRVHIIE